MDVFDYDPQMHGIKKAEMQKKVFCDVIISVLYCATKCYPLVQLQLSIIPLGNGDVLSYEDANSFKEKSGVAGLMIARGALIKPWIFTEIKEQR